MVSGRGSYKVLCVGSSPTSTTKLEIAGCSSGQLPSLISSGVVGSNPTPALHIKDRMNLLLTIMAVIFSVTVILFIYNTIKARIDHRKEIEKLNKQLEKYGKRPISYK